MVTPAFIKTHKAAMLFMPKVSWIDDLTLPYLKTDQHKRFSPV
jgi:hypothetical protein